MFFLQIINCSLEYNNRNLKYKQEHFQKINLKNPNKEIKITYRQNPSKKSKRV